MLSPVMSIAPSGKHSGHRKYKCLHEAHETLDVTYKMGNTVLGTTVKENDLSVTTSADMDV